MGKIVKPEDRIGETMVSNEGYIMKIVDYIDATHIIIEFQDEHKARVECQYSSFKNRHNVRNPYHPSVCGVGYLGEGNYNKKNDLRAYETWRDMLRRCYDKTRQEKQPTYKNVKVCDEWLNFQNFAKWYYENFYEIEGQRTHLDKDILCKGNKIYSPDTCIFVPQCINSLFIKSNKIRGKYPIGVHLNSKNQLVVQLNMYDYNNGKYYYKNIGVFNENEPFRAFTCYKINKEIEIKKRADYYKNFIPNKLYEALYKYEVEIND